MSSAFGTETVLEVRHWTDAYFSFSTTRDAGFRFENGQFVMIGLENEGGRPLMRAYSIASANWEEQLHFFSIKVQDGPLTSRLQHLKPGDKVLVGKKPTGTLLISDLHPGKHLYLLGTGTGLAPWLSIIKDPETYERFDKVILTHGVRFEQDLAYREYFEKGIFEDEILGDIVRDKLLYYPAVTREPFRNHGRLTALMESGQMQETLGLPPMDPANDRFMICGSPQMLADLRSVLDVRASRCRRASVSWATTCSSARSSRNSAPSWRNGYASSFYGE